MNYNRDTRNLKTHCVNGHQFDDLNTYWRPDGLGRVCIECRNERSKKYKAARDDIRSLQRQTR